MIVDIVFGFLGAGKTTFITKVLGEWGNKEKIVVLVNEFGEVGIDGTLLQSRGGNVVEMPSGCICCTLQADFRTQLLNIFESFQPERVIIEPTGVATITQVRSILRSQIFEGAIQTVHNVLVADATGFMGLYKANPHFVESQVKNARIVLLNKCDKVDRRRAVLTRDAISAINPDATVLMTEYGAVDWGQYTAALTTSPISGDRYGERGLIPGLLPAGEEEHEREPVQIHEEKDALGYESFGHVFEGQTFDQHKLRDLFERLRAAEMGEVVRAKGIFLIRDQWMLMELASGEFSHQPVKQAEKSGVSVIGRGLKKDEIKTAFEMCVAGGPAS